MPERSIVICLLYTSKGFVGDTYSKLNNDIKGMKIGIAKEYLEGVRDDVKEAMREFIDKEESVDDVWGIRDMVADLANNAKDYASMYHNTVSYTHLDVYKRQA